MKARYLGLLIAGGGLLSASVGSAQTIAKPLPTQAKVVSILRAEQDDKFSEEMLFPALPGARIYGKANARTGLAAVLLGPKSTADTLVSSLIRVEDGQKLALTVWTKLPDRDKSSRNWVVPAAGALAGGILTGSAQAYQANVAKSDVVGKPNRRFIPFVGAVIGFALPSVFSKSKRTDDGSYLQIRFYDRRGKFIVSQQVTTSAKKNVWQKLQLSVKITGQGYMRLVLGNNSTAPVLFDDFKLKMTVRPPQVTTTTVAPGQHVVVNATLPTAMANDEGDGGDGGDGGGGVGGGGGGGDGPAYTIVLPDVEIDAPGGSNGGGGDSGDGGSDPSGTITIFPGNPSGPSNDPTNIPPDNPGDNGPGGQVNEGIGKLGDGIVKRIVWEKTLLQGPKVYMQVAVSRDASGNITGYNIVVSTTGTLNSTFTLNSNAIATTITGQSGVVDFTGMLNWSVTVSDNTAGFSKPVEYKITFSPDDGSNDGGIKVQDIYP